MDTNANSSGAPRSWAVWATLALLVLFAACSKPEPSAGYARFATGELAALVVQEAPPPMPAEPVRDAAGREASLGELAGGEVMLVNLWATWCAPCMEEMPTLGALRRRFAGAGLKLIAVSVDSAADEAKARSELARLSGGSLEFFIEPSRAILFSARAAGMPVTLLYNREGNEIARLVGGADWASEEAAALIEAALAEDAPDGSGH